AEQVVRDRPRRQLPVRRSRARVGLGQLLKLFGELLFDVLAQDSAHKTTSSSFTMARSASRRKAIIDRNSSTGFRDISCISCGQSAESSSANSCETRDANCLSASDKYHSNALVPPISLKVFLMA